MSRAIPPCSRAVCRQSAGIRGQSFFAHACLGAISATLIIVHLVTACAAETITVAVYGGTWGSAQTECILDPFSRLSGIEVLPDPSNSSVTLAKLIQQKGSPAIDVAWMDGGNSEQAWDAGVIDAIDPRAIQNLEKLANQGIYKTADNQIYALSTGYYATGILYNAKEVKQKPTSWWDLWDSQYAGRVIFPGPGNAQFPGLFLHLNNMLGGNAMNVKPAIDKLKDLKTLSFYEATGTAEASIQSGAVLVGAYPVNISWALIDQGVPIGVAAPKEGLPANDIRVHIVKGTKHQSAAEQFMNLAVSKDALDCLAEKIYVGPPLKSPKLSDKSSERMPWGAGGTINNLVIPDWNVVNAKRGELTETWNRNVLGR